MKSLSSLLLALLFLTACVSHRSARYSPAPESVASSSRSSEGYSEVRARQAVPDQTRTGGDVGDPQKRLIIHNARLTVVVENPDSANVRLTKLAAATGGYVASLGNQHSTIRVKAEQLPYALAEIGKLGRIADKVMYGNDVTEEYTNYQIRLDNATRARARYLELLAKAENVEAALKVEKELERLSVEIEMLEGKIKHLSHLAEFATINIHFREKVKPGVLGYVAVGLYKSVRWLFVRG